MRCDRIKRPHGAHRCFSSSCFKPIQPGLHEAPLSPTASQSDFRNASRLLVVRSSNCRRAHKLSASQINADWMNTTWLARSTLRIKINYFSYITMRKKIKPISIIFIRILISIFIVWCIGGILMNIVFSSFDNPMCGWHGQDRQTCPRLEHIVEELDFALLWPIMLFSAWAILYLPVVIYAWVIFFSKSKKWLRPQDSWARIFSWLLLTVAIPMTSISLPIFFSFLYKSYLK